jgi:hypothetical protein
MTEEKFPAVATSRVYVLLLSYLRSMIFIKFHLCYCQSGPIEVWGYDFLYQGGDKKVIKN